MNSPLERVLCGTAVGDSLGLPSEGLTPGRILSRWRGVWQQRLFFGKGMISDDTEHTVFVAQCLAAGPSSPEDFQHRLAWKFRWWLLCIPAGIGFATLRSILKLWLGFPPARSGVFSAGNGPAMRSAVIGVFWADDSEKLKEFVRASTRLTHTDPRAEIAALAVALTARWAAQSTTVPDPKAMRDLWLSAGPDEGEWQKLVREMALCLERGDSVQEFAHSLGLQKGVSGYAYHSVPVALYAWLHHFGDFRASLEAVLNCGGDTDTVGAITGALAGLSSPIPEEWIVSICDYPISARYLSDLADVLAVAQKGGGLPVPSFHWWALPFRNLLFLTIVLMHGLRRLVPL